MVRYLVILVLLTSAALIDTQAQDDCYIIDDEIFCPEPGNGDDNGDNGGDNGGETPPTESPPPSEDAAPPEGPPWSGYSDGRLNHDPSEYYSLWCAFDRIEIWRSVPDTAMVKLIPLADVLSLSEGQAMDLGDFMSLVRNTSDTVTIYGSNGNRAPDPGQKAFSLSECIARNGGLPETASAREGSGGSEPSTETGMAAWCADPEFFRREFDLCSEVLGYNVWGRLLIQIFMMCTPPFMLMGVFVPLHWHLRGRRRRNRR